MLKTEEFSLEDKRIKDFINFPFAIMENHPFWIAPLRLQLKENFSPKNPFWKLVKSRFFLVFQNGKVVGRIAAIYHPGYNIQNSEQTGFFGFLDAVDDKMVFETLFRVCRQWLKKFNISKIVGPFNPSLNYELGVLIEGFEEFPKFLMPYNPAYYDVRILESGMKKSLDFFAYKLDTPSFQLSPRMGKVSNWLKKRFEISFVNIDFTQIDRDAKKVYSIYNEAFEGHWGYTPFELEEVTYMARELKAIVDKDLFFFIFINGKIAGFILALPDLNEAIRHVKNGRLFPFGIFRLLYYKSKIKRTRVLNVAIKNEFRNMGLGVLLYEELQKRMQEKGYEGGELSWVAENNPNMIHSAEGIGASVVKKYRIYEKNYDTGLVSSQNL